MLKKCDYFVVFVAKWRERSGVGVIITAELNING